MKIILYAETFLPTMGGLERNSYTLAMALVNMHHEVIVITGTMQAVDEHFPFSIVRTNSIKIIAAKIRKADCVFINGGIAMKACLPAYFWRKKYLVIYQMASLYHHPVTNWKSSINNRIRTMLAEKAFMNITVSESARADIRLKNKSAATLLNPIDGHLQSLVKKISADNKQYDLLFAGRLIKGKGVFLLADALKNLLTVHPASTLAYAGEGQDEEALKDYVKVLQLPVTFLGRLDKQALLNAYAAAKLLVVPSTTHIEGSPLVIAEAISLGIPVIASDQPAMIEVVGKAGLIFKSGDITDLTDKLLHALGNTKNLAELTAQCESEKSKFSYQTYYGVLQNILLQIGKN